MPAHRGEIWRASPDPVVGREQSGDRPVLIVSHDRLNASPAQLVIVVPLTTSQRSIPTHVPIAPPAGGVRSESYAMCEQVRSMSIERLRDGPWGQPLPPAVMSAVDNRLRLLLDL